MHRACDKAKQQHAAWVSRSTKLVLFVAAHFDVIGTLLLAGCTSCSSPHTQLYLVLQPPVPAHCAQGKPCAFGKPLPSSAALSYRRTAPPLCTVAEARWCIRSRMHVRTPSIGHGPAGWCQQSARAACTHKPLATHLRNHARSMIRNVVQAIIASQAVVVLPSQYLCFSFSWLQACEVVVALGQQDPRVEARTHVRKAARRRSIGVVVLRVPLAALGRRWQVGGADVQPNPAVVVVACCSSGAVRHTADMRCPMWCVRRD